MTEYSSPERANKAAFVAAIDDAFHEFGEGRYKNFHVEYHEGGYDEWLTINGEYAHSVAGDSLSGIVIDLGHALDRWS